MINIKEDLDQYLLLQSDQKKSFKIQLPTIQKPNISGWFQKETEPQEDTWYQETKRTCCPSLSKVQRITLFALCIVMGIICFSISLMYIPVLLFKARKFALLFTLGSLFFSLSFFFLWGPVACVKHVFAKERLLLTISYVGTLFATLYCALHLQSTPFTVLFAICQIISLLWAVISNVPFGWSGFSLFSRIFSRSVSTTLPI